MTQDIFNRIYAGEFNEEIAAAETLRLAKNLGESQKVMDILKRPRLEVRKITQNLRANTKTDPTLRDF